MLTGTTPSGILAAPGAAPYSAECNVTVVAALDHVHKKTLPPELPIFDLFSFLALLESRFVLS